MSNPVNAVIDSLASQLPDLPQPFSSLDSLAKAEEEDSKRIRPSRVGWWRDALRIRGSIIGRSWQSVAFFTLWAAAVAVLDLVYGRSLSLTNNVTPMMSVVVGLLLVFRNTSAYGRWDEGRKVFNKMMTTVRCLSRTVWINVGAPTPSKGRLASDGTLKPDSTDGGMSRKDYEDKVKALRLMCAFVTATKHHLRGEYGTDWPDLQPLLPPKFNQVTRTAGFGWGAAEADHAPKSTSSTPTARPARSRSLSPSAPPQPQSPRTRGAESLGTEIRRLSSRGSHASLLASAEDGTLRPPESRGDAGGRGGGGENGERRPLLGKRRSTGMSTESMVILNDYMARPSLPLPLIIAHQLGLYFASCKRRNLLESVGPAGYNALVASLNALVEGFTTCERLAGVGIPTVYGIHLKQCTSLFLWTLPLVLVELMGFSMIPFVTVVAFTLVGIEAIASELEQPFGVDDSDLPLDLFCAELRNEVEHTIAVLGTAAGSGLGPDGEWEL
ncbi:uncharacterized protein JCM10292_002237 [Rhodotorula paludigena]|uniref:uncharacterized protein n=1 Tax=Rhodotorula paludigena TaxID=86838 RepID=UPI00317CA2DD